MVDASVAVKWLLPEPFSDQADRILNGWKAGTFQLVAPELLHLEVAGVLWKRVQRGEMLEQEASNLLLRFRADPMRVISDKLLAGRALTLALELRCAVYDASYLALATAVRGTLVTADRRLAETAGGTTHGSRVRWLGRWAQEHGELI